MTGERKMFNLLVIIKTKPVVAIEISKNGKFIGPNDIIRPSISMNSKGIRYGMKKVVRNKNGEL